MKWDGRISLALATVAALFSTVGTPSAKAQGQKPNVVFILGDNIGYGDMGPYGGGELRGYPTPNADRLAREGLRLTQFLVESTCTPSRAALMTGQYSIRNGLSLISSPGSPNQLPGKAYTMGQLFKDAGYATAIFGKWHLGADAQSLPSAHGFDEFYGIPPNTSWNDAITVPLIMMTHSFNAPESVLIEKGPWIMQQKGGGPLERVKPYTVEVREEIDNDLTDRSIAFMKQQHAAGKPFFVYLPFSMGHAPNYPSKQFAGKSRIGQYGDKMMEGDYHVGQVLDTLKELNVDDNTIVVFASDNGPSGWILRELGNLGSPDMGSPGPFRGELGEATEGAIRTFCFIRWPGHIAPNTTSYAMFSEMVPADLRGDPRGQVAYGSSDRRCGPIRSAFWQEQHWGPRVAAHLHRPGSGGRSMETMALLLQRHAPDRHGAANARRDVRDRRTDVVPEGLQHRNGST
ncbi:MAG: sulfatase-like hydrolase/transferase [Candidatus Acidiferrum sp.]